MCIYFSNIAALYVQPSNWCVFVICCKIIGKCVCVLFAGGNQDGKFSVGFRDGVIRTVVGLDRETQAAYILVVEAIGVSYRPMFDKDSKNFIILFIFTGCLYLS